MPNLPLPKNGTACRLVGAFTHNQELKPCRNDYIEMVPIMDVFCDELVDIERLGPCSRLTFTLPQKIDHGPEDRPVHVVARLIIPTENLPMVAQAMLRAPEANTVPPSAEVLH
jgi:hypothetical protein